MAGQVTAQADIGNLSLQGLSAFSNVLAAMSADDVVPSAMLQMEETRRSIHYKWRICKEGT